MLIKYIVYIYIWFQNNPGQVIIWVGISYSVHSNAQTTPVRIYGEPYVHKFCAVDTFWNITRRQAISPVAKFQHVLGRGFVILLVILIFIKCFKSAQSILIRFQPAMQILLLCLYLTIVNKHYKTRFVQTIIIVSII